MMGGLEYLEPWKSCGMGFGESVCSHVVRGWRRDQRCRQSAPEKKDGQKGRSASVITAIPVHFALCFRVA